MIFMKIIYIIRSLANVHGLERTIIDKANYLAEQGHQVIIVTYEQGSHAYAFPISPLVECVDLNCRYFTIFKYSLIKRQYKVWKLKRDFLHKIQVLFIDKNPDIVVASTYEGEFMDEIISLKSRTRIILESHTSFVGHMKGENLLGKIKKRFVLEGIKQCDLLIALTQSDAKCWQQYIQKVAVVPNPISYYPEQISGKCEKENRRILAVGRLLKEKRFDRLINAFALISLKYPEWYIDIYGDGPERAVLEKQVKCQNLENRINFKGNTSNVFKEYQKSQFFVLSSDSEGFGLVLIEAMACGIPVVSTNCPYGPSEIIEDGTDGLLCKLNVEDLSAKMEWMMTHEEERSAMGVAARQAAARYRKEAVMPLWEQTYLGVIRNN